MRNRNRNTLMSDTDGSTSLRLTGIAIALAGALGGGAAHAANYATGGTGEYRNEILWLTWGGGGNGTHDQAVVNGTTTSATIAVTPNQTLQVNCELDAITGGATNGAGLRSYRSGNYSGDPLDNLYNIGASGNTNELIAGINTATGTETKNFVVECNATLGGAPYRIPGLVMADAESLEAGGTIAAPAEYLQGTAIGVWNVVEMLRVAGRTYYATKTNAGAEQMLRFGPGGQNTGTSPGAITFLTFADGAYAPGTEAIDMAFTIKGGGRTAIAIGLLVPKADFGDAPAGYGTPTHLLPTLEPVADGLAANGIAVDINDPAFPLGALAPPSSGYLGSTGPDGESASQPNPNANGDNSNGSAGTIEEDAWPAAYTISTEQAGDPLSQAVVCNGTGTVAGWIDFNRNGSFEPGERAASACSGGSATLNWTLPATLAPGASYVRLRYASNAAQIADATSEADDGEVEDHRIEIVAAVADLRIEKTNPDTEVESGASTTYTIAVTNDGPSAADNTVVSDDWTTIPGLDCSAGPLSCAASGTSGTQCPAAVTPAALQAGVAIPALPMGGVVTFTLTCTVTASGEP
jgi:hypothetical protein